MDEEPSHFSVGHIPLLWLVIPQIAGYLLASQYFHLISPIVSVLVSIGLLASALLFCKSSFRPSLWALTYSCGAFLLAYGYFTWRQPPPPLDSAFAPREAELIVRIDRVLSQKNEGKSHSAYARVVDAPPHLQSLIRQHLYLKTYTPKDSGGIYSITKSAKYQIRGVLERIPDEAANEAGFFQFLKRNAIHYQLQRAWVVKEVTPASWFQHWCAQQNTKLESILDEGTENQTESLLAKVHTAMMLGTKGLLTPEQRSDFRLSGTMHLFAISGLHVGVIATAIYFFLTILRVPLFPRCMVALFILFVYVHITGGAPSAIRAFCMILFYWASVGFRRRKSTFSALLASAVTVLVLQPQQLFSVGFQLSYTVVAGLVLFGQPLIEAMQQRFRIFAFVPEKELTWFHKTTRFLWRNGIGLLGMSFTASLFSAPLTIAHFQIFAPGAILLNMLLVPMAMFSIIAGTLSFALGILSVTPLAILFNHAAWVLLLAMMYCLKFALMVPGIFAEIYDVSLKHALICECILFSTLLAFYHFKKKGTAWFYLSPCLIVTGFLLTTF